MTLSDLIAQAIGEMLEESGSASIRRNELAGKMGCAPSQINYVLTSRFTPEQGYIVESQRGGGGYVRITRVVPQGKMVRMHAVNMIGDAIDLRTARIILQNLAYDGHLEKPIAALMIAAISDSALAAVPPVQRDALRAGILKQMLLASLPVQP